MRFIPIIHRTRAYTTKALERNKNGSGPAITTPRPSVMGSVGCRRHVAAHYASRHTTVEVEGCAATPSAALDASWPIVGHRAAASERSEQES